MALNRHAPFTLAMLLLSLVSIARGKDDDPSAKWVSAYGWIQIGDQLAVAEQWPLAIGSYLESQRRIQELATAHPEFEPELIAYRLGTLEKEITMAGNRLTAEEKNISQKYRDFIQLIELAQVRRFSNEFETAVTTMESAKSLLDQICEKETDDLRNALKPQYQQLEGDIAWLKSQNAFRAANPPVTYVSLEINDGKNHLASLKPRPSDEVAAETSKTRPRENPELLTPIKKRDPNQIRIFILGDSQSQTSFGPEFQKQLVEAGYEVLYHGVKNGTPYFWGGKWRSPVLTRLYTPASSPGEGGRFKDVSMRPRSVSNYVTAYDPDIFIFQAGTNFENILAQEGVAEISQLIHEYTQIAASRGARVFWIGPPDARDNVRSVKKQDKASATLRSALTDPSELPDYSCFFDSRPVCPMANDSGGDGEHPNHKRGLAWAEAAAEWVKRSISHLRCDGKLRRIGEPDVPSSLRFLTQEGFDETTITARAITMELRLVAKSDPGDIRTFPYTDAFSVYRYTLQNAAEVLPRLEDIGLESSPGSSGESRTIYVLHWAVHNNGNGPRVTRIASRKVGGIYDMQLIPLAGHPLKDALGTMTQFNDFDDLLAPIFVSTSFLEERAF